MPAPYDYVSQIQKLVDNGIRISQEILAKQLGIDIAEEKRKIQEEEEEKGINDPWTSVGDWIYKPASANYICPECRENENICDCNKYYDQVYKEQMNGQVVEAMEKNKFIDGKTAYSGTLKKCSTDLAAIKQLVGIDWGKENSQSIGTVSEYWLNGSAKNFPAVDWTMHPIYLELKNNINVKCEIDNKGKITGTVVSNLHYNEQWFLDFEERCRLNNGALSVSSWQDSNFQGLWNFQIQLVEYFVETKRAPQPKYELGSDKPFYFDYAVCNQCDKQDLYKPKTENYTCQNCWPR